MNGAPAHPVRLGVLGCGVIAYWTHLRIARTLAGATLAVAADPVAEARTRATRLTGVPALERFEDVLARDDVDAVVIAAPSHRHADVAVAAATAGKHFYLEKPIATTAGDARRVCDAAQRGRVIAMMGFNRRRHPLYEQARAVVARGRIGRVRLVQTVFSEPAPPAGMPAWKHQRETGGGVLLDLASHHVDLLRWILDDEMAQVRARIASEASEHDEAWVELATRGGVVAQCVFSFRAALADSLTFVGERGTLRVDRHRATLSLRAGRRLGYGTRTCWVPPSRAVLAWWMRRALRPSQEPSYRRALEAFVRAVRDGAPATPMLEDGARTLAVVLAAEESARVGAAVPISAE